MTTAAFIAFALLASRADAEPPSQVIETFDSRQLGTATLDIPSPVLFSTTLSDGTVVSGTPANPAHSGGQTYGGTSITLVTEDEDLFSWPAVGAWVSGSDAVWLQAYEYDSAAGTDMPLAPVSVPAGSMNAYLSIGSLADPRYITKATFYSHAYFTIDDLTLGLEGVIPGIPEPASWATMLIGFAVTGGTMRLRRRSRGRICPQETIGARI